MDEYSNMIVNVRENAYNNDQINYTAQLMTRKGMVAVSVADGEVIHSLITYGATEDRETYTYIIIGAIISRIVTESSQ